MSAFRIGFGYDVHRLKEGIPLVVGGVAVPHHKGALGHSDADVLIHAIMDAMLGAGGLGDIGQHFPDADPGLKGIDSKVLLGRVGELIRERGFSVGNIDSTLSLQQPKIAGLIPAMKNEIAGVLGIEADQVSVKATTTEGLGYVGAGEGVAAYAVVLLFKSPGF